MWHTHSKQNTREQERESEQENDSDQPSFGKITIFFFICALAFFALFLSLYFSHHQQNSVINAHKIALDFCVLILFIFLFELLNFSLPYTYPLITILAHKKPAIDWKFSLFEFLVLFTYLYVQLVGLIHTQSSMDFNPREHSVFITRLLNFFLSFNYRTVLFYFFYLFFVKFLYLLLFLNFFVTLIFTFVPNWVH